MNTLLIILSVLCVALILVVLFLFNKQQKNGQVSQNINESLTSIRKEILESNREHRRDVQSQLERVQDQLSSGMHRSHESMQKQFEQTSKIVQDVTQRLTKLDETNKQVLDFSSQLQNLQHILKNPKQRGVLGEYWLETLLGNVLPKDSYKMQYNVGEDEKTNQKLIADAAIFIRDQIVPIDAKFTLENYNRLMQETVQAQKEKLEKEFKADVKKRIDETSKYIRPDLGTMDFAFMFIPAEGVYYNLLNAEVGSGINSTNLIQYAFKKHVMIVSPTSFYAYLQTVLQGLRELQLEKSTQEIIKRVAELGKHLTAYKDFHDRLGNNLSTVVNQYNQSGNELRKVSKDVMKITDGSDHESMELLETDVIQKPIRDK